MTPDELARGALRDVRRIAVVVVRHGVVPDGADETVAEAGGEALLVGSGLAAASVELPSADRLWLAETASVGPGGLAAALAGVLASTPIVLLPGSPDGRDLAPRLAAALGRPLLAGAESCVAGEVELARLDRRLGIVVAAREPCVVTLLPGVRSARPTDADPEFVELRLPAVDAVADAEVIEELPADPSTMDLAEARLIFGGGAGLVASGSDGKATLALLTDVARALGASAGATRVVTDAGWLDYTRQIGTTGVLVDPDLYVAFGISGASQHIGGLGRPRHVVSVNTDPSCPMTALADLGIVADAPSVLRSLAVWAGVAADPVGAGDATVRSAGDQEPAAPSGERGRHRAQ